MCHTVTCICLLVYLQYLHGHVVGCLHVRMVDVNRVFGHEGNQADDIIYINWLNMARAGLLALEFYTPENAKWRQVQTTARSNMYIYYLE